MSKIFKFLFLLIIFYSADSYASFWDIFSSKSSSFIDNKSECGTQISVFKHFMHDGKICKQDDDCIVMEGQCPLGCYFYINKNFEEIINTEMGKVSDMCSNPVCSSKCPPKSLDVKCIQNKCQPVK